MLYRRGPAIPPKLLLRVVATAGAGALLGFAACRSGELSHEPQAVTNATDSMDGASNDSIDDLVDEYSPPFFTGFVVNPDARPEPCATLPCGPPKDKASGDAEAGADAADADTATDAAGAADAEGLDAGHVLLGIGVPPPGH